MFNTKKGTILSWIASILFCFLAITFVLFVEHYHVDTVIEYNDIEVPGDTIYKTEVKTEYIYPQPEIPDFKLSGKTLVLLDKSGSMKDYITEMYFRNINYFSSNDVWCFDTDVITNFDIDTLEFAGNTNITKALKMAMQYGYDNVVLFSDMEQTDGEFDFGDGEYSINVYIFSPHQLTDTASSSIEFLKNSDKILSIKQFALYGLFE